MAARSENTGVSETIKAMGQLVQNFVPDTGPPDYIIREIRAVKDKGRKNDREVTISFAELYMEKHSRKNPQLEKMKDQGKQIRDNFQKNLFKP